MLCSRDQVQYRGGGSCTIIGKDSKFKLYWSGNDKGTAGVGLLVAEEWIEKVFDFQKISYHIILVKLIVGQQVMSILSVYAPHSGLSDEQKDLLYDEFRAVLAKIPISKFLFPWEDWKAMWEVAVQA